ncbi:Spx/MgsR family RNA polymerase-binding regulatory protein [Oscillibacter sp.]|uniref:Spx/MgsR family RNA polymerase-binding regulatory protein n=1 Tax=Oscillibacter sp. TaxID=1945593 RepID=UPI002618280D|nr:Spx/MgsR family RNA polymerase-binding regulatory protein [Oscillibacter sp.]MDD3347099.1 Spx/MgsR family RNA polymerase-binding regulatory protein [Oscillibacter sp.]
MLFVCYPKCSTCQKAKAWLEARGIAFETRNIKEAPPTAEELARWQLLSGKPLTRFVNTSGAQYRALGVKASDLEEEALRALLAGSGMLVKRPILVGDELALVGFHEAEWGEKLT